MICEVSCLHIPFDRHSTMSNASEEADNNFDASVETDDDDVDLDAFLTSIESKLRGPYSSLELTKAIATPALRVLTTAGTAAHTSRSSNKPCSARQYLRRISKILSRADKATQLRILIALLGLEENGVTHEKDDVDHKKLRKEVSRLVQQAQTAPTYDEWVIIVAGLVQYKLQDGTEPSQDEPPGAAMGAQAKKMLDTTCKKILQRVNTRIRQTEQYEVNSDDEEKEDEEDLARKYLAATADAAPTLAPFHYALLSPSVLAQVLPEAVAPNPHFRVNETADILLMDANLEQQKALDEQEHATATTAAATAKTSVAASNNGAELASSSSTALASNPAAPGAPPIRPSMKQLPVKKKSSMFLVPTKPLARPGMAAAGSRQPVGGGAAMRAQPVLHTRKAGAAQALLRTKKNSIQRNNPSGAPAAVGTTTAVSRPLMTDRHAQQRSKMKIMDVTEVQDQYRKQQQQTAEATGAGAQNKKKRKADATEEPQPKAPKVEKESEGTSSAAHEEAASVRGDAAAMAAATAAAALSAYQQAKTSSTNPGNGVSTQSLAHDHAESASRPQQQEGDHAHGVHAHRQQDWRQMLKEKSNRISTEDRVRIEQFFQNTFGQQGRPSGAIKIKLHEERLPDRKETYYLELDYDNLTSKQSKKTKRYNT